MRKYKTSEAIKMLEENPKLKFKAKNNFSDTLRLFVDDGGYITMQNTGCSSALSGNIRLTEEWELVKQEITFEEAIKSYVQGKTICCEYSCGTSYYVPDGYCDGKTSISIIKDENGFGLSSKEILEGKWYIKEE